MTWAEGRRPTTEPPRRPYLCIFNVGPFLSKKDSLKNIIHNIMEK